VQRPPFHLAFPVADIEAARRFYTEILGCRVGRENTRWIDFDFRGHQITAHLSSPVEPVATNTVDGRQVPVRHFGLILEWQEWQDLAAELTSKKVEFLIEPHVRFAGQPGEQATLFISDPSGNGLEFKAFRDPSRLFARD
jgi:extradiol dioxygenase family protein